MAKLSLSQINDAVEENYGDFTINCADEDQPEDIIAFRYFLRAPREARAKVAEAFNRLNGQAEEDQDRDVPEALVDIYRSAFKALAVKSTHFTKLDKALGDDVAAWTYVLGKYAAQYQGQEGEGLGEA